MLDIQDLTVRYGSLTAVDAVSLSVAPGEIVAVLGASGSGKSSLLRGVAGLEPLAGGRVLFDGDDVTGTPVHKRGFVVMFQDGQLFPHLSVAGNVGYGLAKLPRPDRDRRVADLLELVGLAGYGERPITALSGGQAQRVALARSLAPNPRLLLLDEPLSSLDRALRERLADALDQILHTTGTTALYVTHDQDEAFTLADRVAIMREGRLVQVATPDELRAHPVDSDVAAFLGNERGRAPHMYEDGQAGSGPSDDGRRQGLSVPPARLPDMATVIVNVMPKPEILDPQGKAVTGALQRLGFAGFSVRQGKRFEVEVDGDLTDERLAQLHQAAETLLANTVIETFDVSVDDATAANAPTAPQAPEADR